MYFDSEYCLCTVIDKLLVYSMINLKRKLIIQMNKENQRAKCTKI